MVPGSTEEPLAVPKTPCHGPTINQGTIIIMAVWTVVPVVLVRSLARLAAGHENLTL